MYQPDLHQVVPLGAHIQSWLRVVAPDWQYDRHLYHTALRCLSEYLNMSAAFMSVSAQETISSLEDGIVFLSMPTLQALNKGNSISELDETARYAWKKAFLDVSVGLYLQLHQIGIFDNYDHIRVLQLGHMSILIGCYLLPVDLY